MLVLHPPSLSEHRSPCSVVNAVGGNSSRCDVAPYGWCVTGLLPVRGCGDWPAVFDTECGLCDAGVCVCAQDRTC